MNKILRDAGQTDKPINGKGWTSGHAQGRQY